MKFILCQLLHLKPHGDIRLRHTIATQRLPHIIVTDKGTLFTSNGLKTFCTMIGIKHIITTLIIHRRIVQSQERCKRLNL